MIFTDIAVSVMVVRSSVSGVQSRSRAVDAGTVLQGPRLAPSRGYAIVLIYEGTRVEGKKRIYCRSTGMGTGGRFALDGSLREGGKDDDCRRQSHGEQGKYRI